MKPTIAEKIARKAHEGQFRRDGVTPYITHPEAVVKMLEGSHREVIDAAWLHDVLEDTNVTVPILSDKGMSWRVIDAVIALTRELGESYENFIVRAHKNPIARKVKIADIMHNLSCEPTKRQRTRYLLALQTLKP